MSNVVFRLSSSSVKGCLSFLGFSPECGKAQLSLSLSVSSSLRFSPECGIAQLSLSLFVSSSWSISRTSSAMNKSMILLKTLTSNGS